MGDAQMSNRTSASAAQFLSRFSGYASVGAIAFGFAVLAGWAFHIDRLKTFIPGQVAVKGNTACCFILLGLALWLVRKEGSDRPRRIASRCLSVLVAIIGALSLLEFCCGWDLRIDHLIFAAGIEDLPGSVRPGLMSPLSGGGFFLLGIAVALVDAKARWGAWVEHILACVAAVISIFGILDFVFDPQRTHTYISPATALLLFGFSFAALCSRTQSGLGALLVSATPGGELSRRLLPAAVCVPVLISWLRWKGQQAGLYSEWMGVVIMAVAAVALLTGITVWTAIAIERTDAERRRAQEALSEERRRFEAVLDQLPVMVCLLRPDYSMAFANRSFRRQFGDSKDRKCYEFCYGKTAPCEFCQTFEVFRKGVPHDWEVATNDGRLIHAFDFPFRDTDGSPLILEMDIDVTEQKEVEKKLLEASRYARSLIEASLDPLVTISKEGKITDVNQATESATGFSRNRLIGSDFSDYFTEPEKAREGYQHVFEKGFVRDYPLALRRSSGEVMEVLYNSAVLRGPNAEVEGVFATARDITERKRAEEALNRSETRYRSLVTAASQIVWTTNALGEVVEDMPLWRSYTGMTREEIQGWGWLNSLHPDDRARTAEAWNTAVAKKSLYEVEYRIRRHDGQYREFVVRGAPVEQADGAILEWVGTCTDVTVRKRDQELVRKAGLYARTLIEASLDPLVTIGKDGRILDVNHATEEVTGSTRQQLIGSDFSTYFTEPEKARRGYEEVFSKGFVQDYPLAIRQTSGSVIDVLYNATVYRNEAGEVEGVFAAARDVTRIKAAEQEVRQLNDELEERVVRRTAELEAANKELEAFTYSVSHDLRAPLRHISGFSKMLSEEFSASLPKEAQHYLTRIQDGTHRMGTLVDDLLNLARIGRRDLTLQVAGLKSVVDEVIDILQPDCAGRRMEWKINDLPYVECDTALVKQIFQNLLSNALKFTRPREIALIEVGQSVRDGSPVIYVRDNGVGFSMKYADKLFGVFQRLHRAEDFEGTGVGLATVQRIVQKHGGRIWAEAELEKGATFYFTLGSCRAANPAEELLSVGGSL